MKNNLLPFSINFLIKICSDQNELDNYKRLENSVYFKFPRYLVCRDVVFNSMPVVKNKWYILSNASSMNYNFKTQEFDKLDSLNMSNYQSEDLMQCLSLVKEWLKLDYNGNKYVF